MEKLIKLFNSVDATTVHAAAMAISNLSQNGTMMTHSLLLWFNLLICKPRIAKLGKLLYDSGVGNDLKPLASSADAEVKSEAESAIANINLYGTFLPSFFLSFFFFILFNLFESPSLFIY